MEKTLILLKPDAFQNRKVGATINRLEQAGLMIAAAKLIRLDSAKLREHYAHIADKPFYPSIEAFMSSSPVMAMVLKGEGVIQRVRRLIGPTNSLEAPAGTVRGDWGTDMTQNIIHASDGVETAEKEIKRFFEPAELLA